MTKRETAKKRQARPQSGDEDAQRRRQTQPGRDGRTEERELSRKAKSDSKKHAQLSSVCRSQGRICFCVSVCNRRGGGLCADSRPAVAALAAVCPMRSAVCDRACLVSQRPAPPRVDADAFYFWPALPVGLINSVFAASLTVLRPTNSTLAGKLLGTKGSRGGGYVHGTLQGKGYSKHLDCKLCWNRMSLTSPISCENFL